MDYEDRQAALAKYLELPVKAIIYDPDHDIYGYGTQFNTPDGTYVVMDSDEANQAVYDDVEQLISDLGLDAFSENFQDWIVNNALDDDWFEQYCYENYRSYAEDIDYEEDEEYGSRFLQECVENGIISGFDIVDGEYLGDEDMDDLYKKFADSMVVDIGNRYDSYYAWAKFNFGSDWVSEVIENGDADFDLAAIVEELIDTEGYGPTLSQYDCKEIDLGDDLYAFKQDDRDLRGEELY